jgi:SAM-dependent methyltransferase
MGDSSPERQLLGQMLVGPWIAQGIHVAAELGIADWLAEGPRTARELATLTGAHADSLYRLLRALASVGIFAQDDRGRFCLTPLAERLRSDAEESQRAFAIMAGAEFYQTWGKLLHSVRTGEPGFQAAFGMPFFEYMTRRPERHRIYDAAMTGVHGVETDPMVEAYDFSACRTVVDVGGGNGLMLAAILKRHPGVRGILFDLPAVAERARPILAAQGLDGRCEVAGGDFFSEVPEGADAYVMRHVVHDWQDEDAAAILRNCREAMAPGGRILVVETVIPRGDAPCFGKWLDLMMLLVAGRERTEGEFRALFARAGLRLGRIVPTSHEVSVIEGIRAAVPAAALSPAAVGSENAAGVTK